MITDKEILQAALLGYEAERRRIEDAIIEIQNRMGGGGGVPPPFKGKAAPKTKKSKKRVMSAEARARIAEAQKKRWAAYHKKQKTKAS